MSMRPGIILLREGTDTSQGKPQLISNMNACQAVADMVRSTLGPAGRDKLVATSNGRVTISNDGATIMKLLEIEHPAARTLVDIAQSQDLEVGDGTTSVVLLAGEILTQIKPYVEEGVHPRIIMKNLRLAGKLAVEQIHKWKVSCHEDASTIHEMLIKTASTALNSKLIANHKDLFAPMIVRAVQSLYDANTKDNNNANSNSNKTTTTKLDDINNLIAIKRIPGGDVRQSFLVEGGVAFKKTFSYAGFEQMTKKFTNPQILLLNVELELKSEKENAEIRIDDVSQYQSIVDAEWQLIYEKLDACVKCGANIVLSKLPIGDLATQYFLDRGLFCAGRVTEQDMKRVAKATGAQVQTSCRQLSTTTTTNNNTSVLGTCGVFEERQVGDERFNVFSDCPRQYTSTIVLRGGTEQFIAESERSIHDAIMVVKRALESGGYVVAGGGAIEMNVSAYLRNYALLNIQGKGQLIVSAYAKALEIIPRQLCDNAGFDSTDILAALRKRHATAATAAAASTVDKKDCCWYGVDLIKGDICDTYEAGVWEPSDNKTNSFAAATEAACVILSIDETVIAPKSQDPAAAQASGMMGGGGMGGMPGGAKPMSNMMSNAMAVGGGGGGPSSGQLGPGVSYMKGRGM